VRGRESAEGRKESFQRAQAAICPQGHISRTLEGTSLVLALDLYPQIQLRTPPSGGGRMVGWQPRYPCGPPAAPPCRFSCHDFCQEMEEKAAVGIPSQGPGEISFSPVMCSTDEMRVFSCSFADPTKLQGMIVLAGAADREVHVVSKTFSQDMSS
jgi:hypothetical protein